MQLLNSLRYLAPTSTVWLNIDNLTTFSFKPSSLDNSFGQGAYLLTYYAKPVYGSSYSKTTTGNSFAVSGEVTGPGGTGAIILPSIQVSTSTLLTGSMDFSVSKSAWYGDVQDTSDELFGNGTLYWIITVKGSRIPVGIQLQDTPGSKHSLYTSNSDSDHKSIAGVYLSSIADADALTSTYKQFSQINNNDAFIPVSDDDWSWNVSGNKNNSVGTFTFNNNIALNNQQLYIIVRTTPNDGAFTGSPRPTANFTNSLSMRNNMDESYTEAGSASLFIASVGTNFKEVGEWATYSAESNKWENTKQISSGNKPEDKILTSWTAANEAKKLSSGTYIDYRLIVNYLGDEEGTLRVEDLVPEGMEPVYVRYFWTKPGYTSKPEMSPIADLPDGNWSEIGVKNAALDGGAKRLTKSAFAYYDTTSRKILFDVTNLNYADPTLSDDKKTDTMDIQVQIAMRVTDSEVLKGVKKEFINTMNVYAPSGNLVNSSSTSTEIQISDSIAKTNSNGISSNDTLDSSNKLQTSFTITVNPRSEDLLDNSDSLTLVDNYSQNLEIDLSSLKVKESATSTDNVPFTYQIDNINRNLTLVIPDNKKLVITYNATIQAPLGSTVNISNNAYWYGYKDYGVKWLATNVKVEAAGSVDFNTNPIIRIAKVDSENALKKLEGATFSLYEADYSEADKRLTLGNKIAEKTTGSDGKVAFGTSSDASKLKFNKIYGIVETSSPVGYVSSNSPVYFGTFKSITDENTTVTFYPKNMDSDSPASNEGWSTVALQDLANKANIYYTSNDNTYTWPNSRTSIEVKKSFIDADDTPLTFPSGEFKFGLFYNNQLIQMLTISNINGKMTYLRTENGVTEAETRPLFTGLNTNDIYSIYELDEEGNPIEYKLDEQGKPIAHSAAGIINGEEYEVDYQGGSTTLSTTDASEHTFSISNRTSVTISGTKTWDDNNDLMKKRSAEVTVRLHADGVVLKDQVRTVNEGTNWSYSFTNLPKYKDGKKIKYTISEDSVSDYSTEIVGYNIKNTYTSGQTSVTVTKAWKDQDNQDGIRPEDVKVQLFANGNKSGDIVLLGKSNKWTYTWENLPETSNGTPITYTVQEEPVLGYSSEITGDATTGFTITNTHSPEMTSVSGTKTWDDSDNLMNKRPEAVTVRLHANGTEVKSLQVSGDDHWEYSFTNLPKYKNGKEIEYTVSEDSVPDYSTEIDGYDIKNTYTSGKTSVAVNKVWNDDNDRDKKRPSSVSVQLYANGEASGQPITLSESNKWAYTWDNLPERLNGKDISYSIKEEPETEGYSSEITGDASKGFTITNTHSPEVIKVSGIKTWEDSNNQDGKRPESIVVKVLANGIEAGRATVKADSNGNWKYSFENLPKYENGNVITYTISEDAVSDYTTNISGFNIANTHTPGKTSVTVTKAWEDKDNQDRIRPESVQVQLYANGTESGDPITLNSEGKWTYTWKELDEKSNGKDIAYTVAEVQQSDSKYTSSISGNQTEGYTITNSYTPVTIDISGTKTWDDSNNQDGKRPDSITVRLLADGKEVNSQEVTSNNGWKYAFTGLPKNKDGKAIDYTITEDEVPEYSTTISGNNITNSYTPGKTSVTVTKVWDDGNNQDNIRPKSVQVQLYADGTESGEKVTLDRNNEWNYTWNNLDEMKDGKAIEYTVQEVSVSEGYTQSISGDAKKGFTITNSHTPEVTSVSGNKTWNDAGDQDGKRPESVTVRLHADGREVDSQEVSSSTNWSYSFNDLPKYENGKEITYTVTEDSVQDYSTEITGHNITNSYTPGETSLTVTKVWDDSNNQDGLRPASIEVELFANGTGTGEKVLLNSDNEWTHTWEKLSEMRNGKAITYTVKEGSVPDGYTSTVVGDAETGYTIVNAHESETTEVSGTKTWNDVDNQDGRRPDSIVVKLLADGIEADRAIVEADENGEWRYSFTGLPANSAGKKISYSILEENVPDYSPEYSGYDITNSYTPGKTSVTVTKVWDDGNNQDNIRPESVQVQLYADGIASGDPVTLNSDGNWTYTWTDLDQMKNGAEIVYTIQETSSADGYTDSVSGDASKGFTIINHHTPAEKPGTDTSTNNSSSGGDSSPSAEPVSQKNLVPDTADHTDLLQHGITAIASLTIALIAVVAYRKYE